MAPKKQNAFYIFMTEKKPEVERMLKRKVTMAELPDLLYNEWKNMSEKEKLKYKTKCKGFNNCREKMDSRGIPLSVIRKEEEEKRMKDQEMKKNIRTTVDMLKTGKAITSANFFLIHMSYYVHLANGAYIPAEIGVVHFSFAKGVTTTFHQIFPKSIPVGYHYDAMTHSNETHNLMSSLTKNCQGFEDDLEMFLLKSGTKMPFVYTQNEMMESVESMLRNFNFMVPLKVYSLDNLYQHLYSASLRDIPESISTQILQSSQFDYAPKISCNWHDKFAPDSIKYCSLSCCHRWVFNMCNALRLQDAFGIIPEKGKHYPDFSSFEGVVDVYQTTFPSQKLSEEENVPLVRKSKEKMVFDSVLDEEDFDAEMDNLKISNSPLEKKSEKSSVDSGNSESSGFWGVVKTKEIAGIPIGCLGLSGFGRGKRKSKN